LIAKIPILHKPADTKLIDAVREMSACNGQSAMMFRTFICRRALFIAAVSILATCSAVRGDDIDHEAARQLARKGAILPLAEIVAVVGKRVPGDVLEVELEREDGAYVYELKILMPNGKVMEVEADAATGKVLSIEGDH
jgi:uncharacterized membrane protein YkoI